MYDDHSTCMYYDHSHALVHACTTIIVHACTMIIVCMYYDHSTCMYYDHIPYSIWDEFMLDDVGWGDPGGEAPGMQGGVGGRRPPNVH